MPGFSAHKFTAVEQQRIIQNLPANKPSTSKDDYSLFSEKRSHHFFQEKEGEQSSNTTHSDLDKENTGSSVQKLTSCEQRPLSPIENLKIISEMQDVIAEVLKKYLERNNIKEYCKMVITILIDLRDLEGCDEHKSDLKRFILDLVTRFLYFIYLFIS
ncbi:uncharacterized protein [Choristoneura fumiferana]|uniref:uncharacterized protein n=1 Tax=Choristoneura fumiferana TaxID=7141 RepID=UPI003D159678